MQQYAHTLSLKTSCFNIADIPSIDTLQQSELARADCSVRQHVQY